MIKVMATEIISVGHYVPQSMLSNFDLEKIVETSDEWITERTGIKERRIAEPGIATSDLAKEAANLALKRANLSPDDIDVLIVSTATPDTYVVSTACHTQDKIGARNAYAFDIWAACPGFIYGLKIAKSLINSGEAKTVLVIGAETLSRFVDWEDRATCVLFGDGAGAVIVGNSKNDEKIIDVFLGSDGSLKDLLIMPAGGALKPFSPEVYYKRECYIKMKGREVFKNAVLKMEEAVDIILSRNNIKPEEINFFIPHQANIRIIEALRERLKLPNHKVYVNIEKYGNTSAASIPIALSEMEEKGLLKRGHLLLLVSFGAGFTWGSALIRW
ncbi:MAG: beta-ketoacyl-ACP synthase III [Candidatus Hydrothermales bacterium]